MLSRIKKKQIRKVLIVRDGAQCFRCGAPFVGAKDKGAAVVHHRIHQATVKVEGGNQ